jgi:hypothetical protein
MNRHVIHPDQVTHQSVQHLLPWLLAGTLDSADIALIEPHLQTCARCRADLDWQRQVRAAAPPPDAGFDADRALAQLLPRLGPQAPRSGLLDRWRQAVAANSAWLRWTAVAQLAAIGALSIMLIRPASNSGDYRALGAAASAQRGNVVLMFKPDTTEREMRRILQASAARVIDGPTVTGAYVLALPAAQASPAALARLRAESAVTLAQPLAAGGQP